MARALVLGATGHIGAHIVRSLIEAGHSVRACYRSPQYLGVLQGLPVEVQQVDLEAAGFESALEDCEWLFFAAGYYPDYRDPHARAVARATQMARRVFAACARRKPQRIVYTSSAATIARIPGRIASEADAIGWPPSEDYPVYTMAKLAMEQEALRALARDLPVVILNPSICIGEYDSRCFSGRLLTLYARDRFPFYLDHQLNLVDTRDVGRAHVLAAQHAAVGERYILNGETLSMRAWIERVSNAIKRPIFSVPLGYGLAMRAAWTAEKAAALCGKPSALSREVVKQARLSQVLSSDKAKRFLQWEPQSIDSAVERALHWFREAGVLEK